MHFQNWKINTSLGYKTNPFTFVFRSDKLEERSSKPSNVGNLFQWNEIFQLFQMLESTEPKVVA